MPPAAGGFAPKPPGPNWPSAAGGSAPRHPNTAPSLQISGYAPGQRYCRLEDQTPAQCVST